MMKILPMVFVLALCAVLGSPAAAQSVKKPVPLIFDTDMGNDVDDALALGMIHALQSRGECELLAVTLTKDNALAASYTDAVNTFYGRGEVPIGICRSGVTPAEGKFIGLGAKKENGTLRYANDLQPDGDIPDAVDLLRKTLAAAEDGSVVIAQVGFSTNLANLLSSPADTHSELMGAALVKKKVRLLSIMAGAFTKIPNREGELQEYREYNVIQDLPSAQQLAQQWPTPIVWSGFEIGIALPYPHQSIEQDYGYVEHHPVADAYYLYSPPPHDRPTWDLTSVLIAVRPDRGYFDLSPAGRVTVDQEGYTKFEAAEGGRDRYLIITEAQKGRTLEALVQLSSQPPCSK